MKESNRIELKRELTASLEKEVVAFLNYREGGHIYIGIGATGTVLGVPDGDAVQLKIKDRIKNNIMPSTLGLFDVIAEQHDDRTVRVQYEKVIRLSALKGRYIPAQGNALGFEYPITNQP